MNNVLKIAPAKFMQDPAIAEIFALIASRGGNVKFVGGCIRNLLLEKKINDIDLATDLEAQEVAMVLENNNIICLKNNIEYGTITALINNIYSADIKKIEITTLRKDVATFGRKAETEYIKSFEEDAKRRDFTINALYADLDGTIYDFFNGHQDILDKRLVFIGNPEERIKEDYLRILRYFRFYATLDDFMFDDAAIDACVKNAENLKQLSGERIAKELFLILDSKNPAIVLELMQQEQILDKILPNIGGLETLKNLIWIESNAQITLPNFTTNPIRRLAALIKQNKETAQKTAEKLKLTLSQTKRLITLLDAPFEVICGIEEKMVRKILHNYGADIFQDFVLLKWARERLNGGKTDTDELARWYDLLEMASLWRPLEFDVRGKDVLSRGIPEGEFVGEILFRLESWWQEKDFRPTHEELLEELDKIVLKYKKKI